MKQRGRLTQATWSLSWLAWVTLFLQQATDALIYEMPAIIWFGKLFPLLLFVPGMFRDRLRSFIWLCFVSLLYFVAQVERIFAQPGDMATIVGLVAVVTLFCASMMYVRWRARELRTADTAIMAEEAEND